MEAGDSTGEAILRRASAPSINGIEMRLMTYIVAKACDDAVRPNLLGCDWAAASPERDTRCGIALAVSLSNDAFTLRQIIGICVRRGAIPRNAETVAATVLRDKAALVMLG